MAGTLLLTSVLIGMVLRSGPADFFDCVLVLPLGGAFALLQRAERRLRQAVPSYPPA